MEFMTTEFWAIRLPTFHLSVIPQKLEVMEMFHDGKEWVASPTNAICTLFYVVDGLGHNKLVGNF